MTTGGLAVRYNCSMWRLLAIAVLCAAVSSTAWALVDYFVVRCTSPAHGRKGWQMSVASEYSEYTGAAACKVAAEDLMAYPRHKPKVLFFSDDPGGPIPEQWDCQHLRPAPRTR